MKYYKKFTLSKTVIVNLKTDKAFKGVLVEEKTNLVILKNVELIEQGTESVNVAGSVLIEKQNIDFIQIIGG
jgi:small nuclear ribonucleoprotein (snRNP)-like protein